MIRYIWSHVNGDIGPLLPPTGKHVKTATPSGINDVVRIPLNTPS